MFELTNEEREALCVEPAPPHWEKKWLSEDCFVYFDQDDIIRKRIRVGQDLYDEAQLSEQT